MEIVLVGGRESKKEKDAVERN